MNAPANMQSRVQDYLDERRRLGFQLKSAGRTLMNFAQFVDALDQAGPLTSDVMIEWARQDKQGCHSRATSARRFKLLRPFARYLQQFEAATAIPDEVVFGPIPGWQMPHIYRDQEVVDLLAAARGLGPAENLRAATYETLFGLLAATGLRLSEAVHLLDADVDLMLGLLTVRQTKFNKSRQLPLHPSTTAALLRYRQLRHQSVQERPEAPFFVGTHGKHLGKKLSLRQVDRVFNGLRKQLGWINRGAHDLRHTFAVRRVLLWHEQGTDIDQAMLALSTYMGHAKISHTYWYLTAVPELMAVAAGKFERFAQAKEVDYVQ
ncbi:MAG: tyrosine-type recombinase/integrase [Kiritimatiellales bacterium]|jgi:integrase